MGSREHKVEPARRILAVPLPRTGNQNWQRSSFNLAASLGSVARGVLGEAPTCYFERLRSWQSIYGSGRESVETFDLRGFSSCVQFDSSSRRGCGNVETRVCWGYPSSEGGRTRGGRRRSIIPPSELHFHSEAPVYRPFWRECVVWAAGGTKIGASQKAA